MSTTTAGPIRPRFEVRLDGAGAAHAIDHVAGSARYILEPQASEFELRLAGLRSLMRSGSAESPGSPGRPAWLAQLELASRTLLVSGRQDGELEELRLLTQRTLGAEWQVAALQPTSASVDEQSMIETLSNCARARLAKLGPHSGDYLTCSLRSPSLDARTAAGMDGPLAAGLATRDYAHRRKTSFIGYYKQHPADHTLALARRFAARAIDGTALAERLRTALARAEPLSFVRVGEGEGCFLALERYARERSPANEVLGVCAKDIFRIWFDRNIHETPADEVAGIRQRFWDAISGADILGVPTQERVAFEYARFADEVAAHGFSRGYVGVSEILAALSKPPATVDLGQKLFTDCDIARPLYPWQSWDAALVTTLPRLLYRRRGVTFVTCHTMLAPSMARILELQDVRTLAIPPERGRVSGEGHLAGDHVRDHFERICEGLRRDPSPLVIVAAGFLGKSYCAVARKAGAVAIDIGSLADHWVGAKTRQRDTWSTPSPFA